MISTASATASADAPTVTYANRFGGDWYEDALREARAPDGGDLHNRRREVVLAVLSFVGGFQNLPFADSLQRLEIWLEPVVHGA